MLPNGPDKKQAIEDLETIMDKIKLHVGGDLKERTAEALAPGKGGSANNVTANELLAWLLKLHRVDKCSRIRIEKDFTIRGPRAAWDLGCWLMIISV